MFVALGTAAGMGSKSSNPDSLGGGDSPDTILVGSVVRPQALRGEVRIKIHSDVPDRFRPGRELILKAPDQVPRKVRIASFRTMRGGGVIRFEGWEDCDQAETLRGARLEVARQDVPRAPDGLFYHFDLVGCSCLDAEHGDLGRVTAVLEDGGGVLLEVESERALDGDGGRTLLIPFVEAFLEDVDIDSQVIRCRLPAGLIETCASKS